MWLLENKTAAYRDSLLSVCRILAYLLILNSFIAAIERFEEK